MIVSNFLYAFYYLYSKIRYRDILEFKEYLFNSDKNKKIHSYLESAYLKRMSKMGFSIGYTAKFIGAPLFPHGLNGIFISGKSVIGRNCTIYQQVTIGSNLLIDSKHKGTPVIGDNVFIGAGAMIIGNVTVGNNCRIGANAVVAKDIPDNTIVVPQMNYIHRDTPLDNYYYVEKGEKLYRYEDAKLVEAPK